MRRGALREGDLIRIKLSACRHEFDARVEGFDGSWVLIDPVKSWPTWRRVKLGDIAKRLDPPPRKRRRRSAA